MDAKKTGEPASVGRVEFREAMSRLAAAVTVVTSDGPAGRAGFTATAVTPVSDDPPMLLICLNRASRSHAVLQSNGVFCVNVLAACDTALANRFAGRRVDRESDTMDTRFAAGTWVPLVTGAPALSGALVVFDCRIQHGFRVATHDVIIGVVAATQRGDRQGALVYRNRAFAALSG